MSINNKMDFPIQRDDNGIPYVVDEDNGGKHAVPVVLVEKNSGNYGYKTDKQKINKHFRTFTGSQSYTFPELVNGFSIINFSAENITVQASGETITVPANGGISDVILEPFTTIIITATGDYQFNGVILK